MTNVERMVSEIETLGRKIKLFNVNAADPEKREAVLDKIAASVPEKSLRVFLYSLAFGSIRPLISCAGKIASISMVLK